MRSTRHWVDSNGVRLAVQVLGDDTAPPLVMLHGMRDVAASLLPVAEPLATRFRVVLPDLRGHGESDQPGAYTFEHYLFDLHRVLQALRLDPVHLFGHSLGGQIAVRYAAVFPTQVLSTILAEGLGPPDRPGDDDSTAWLAHHGAHLLDLLAIPQRQRPLPDLDFAVSRLLVNNPRLNPIRARALAEQATRLTDSGERVWAFDPRVQSVFVAHARRLDVEPYWRSVRCPVLIVSGDLAHEYWCRQIPIAWDGRFAPDELEARVRTFARAEHVALADAGHMVHFDQPAALTRAVADFLERQR
jgi:pimeloyl-ACP methyl ester carboxylesterase